MLSKATKVAEQYANQRAASSSSRSNGRASPAPAHRRTWITCSSPLQKKTRRPPFLRTRCCIILAYYHLWPQHSGSGGTAGSGFQTHAVAVTERAPGYVSSSTIHVVCDEDEMNGHGDYSVRIIFPVMPYLSIFVVLAYVIFFFLTYYYVILSILQSGH
jgi:hypothetical protein